MNSFGILERNGKSQFYGIPRFAVRGNLCRFYNITFATTSTEVVAQLYF
jgi:hypothetical protein